jgi:HlyD family secretion protein
VNVVAGDQVKQGQILATLSAADAAAQLSSAQAGLDAAEAHLEAVKNGARPEDIAVSDAQVTADEAVASEMRTALADKIVDAYAKADDAVRGKTDQFYADPTGTLPTLTFFIADSGMTTELNGKRIGMETELRAWQSSLATLDAGTNVLAASAGAKTTLGDVKGFLDDMAIALDMIDLHANPTLTQATLDGWKINSATARANLTAALSSLSAGETSIRSADDAVLLAQSQKDLKSAGPTSTDVATQDAAVAQAQAAVQAADAQLAKAVLRAPFDGTVSHVAIHQGDMAAPGAPAISVISGDRFEIDALASETQVAQIHAGEAVNATLDGFGTAVSFPADVLRIDLAPIAVDGMSGYPVKLRFSRQDDRIKAGMTANVHVEAASAANVIVIPRQAMLLQGNDAMVLLKKDGVFVQKTVTTGLASDTLVEIKDGLNEGDQIADFGGNK